MKFNLLAVTLSALAFSAASHATPVTINPASDGSLYSCSGCNTVSDGAYVLTGGYIQGAIKFSTAGITGKVSNATLTLNPYGLPLWGQTVDVFGYGTAIGALVAADADAGTFIGTLTLPAGLGYGQDAYFDVTSFVAGINSPYIAFNLRSSGTNVFSSLEYNYGHPSQLLVTTVSEPSSLAIPGAGILILLLRRASRRTRT